MTAGGTAPPASRAVVPRSSQPQRPSVEGGTPAETGFARGLLDPIVRRLRAVHAYFFRDLPASPEPSGLLGRTKADGPALAISFGIGIAIALLLEWVMLAHPVPPGGDPGEWVTSSYPWVNLPAPSWIIPGQYPPGLFPLLGSLVILGGGPVMGARLYVGVVTTFLGASTYLLGRSLTRTWSLPLLAEGFVLLNPSFLLLFFFGAYPNLLGFVFFNIALAYTVRFTRTHRSAHIFIAWVATTAAVLTHSLVAIMLAVTLILFWGVMLVYRRIPKEIYASRGAWAGMGLFALGVGGFYFITRLVGVPHPHYLQTGQFAHVKNGPGHFIFLLSRTWLHHLILPPVSALLVLGVAEGGLAALVLYARFFRPKLLTVSEAMVMAMIGAPVGLMIGGWELFIVSDYVRMAYFLITPLVLGVALIVQRFLMPRPDGLPLPRPPRPKGNPLRFRVRWAVHAVRYRVPRALLVFSVGVVLLLVLCDLVSLPLSEKYELNSTRVGHDQAFLDALNYIRHSGVPGSVLTVSGAVKWTRALLVRDAYAPYIPGRFSFDPPHILAGELAYLALTGRYAVNNNLVAASTSGTNSTFLGSSPVYQAAIYGTFTPVVVMPANQIEVTYGHFGAVRSANLSGSPSITVTSQNQSWLTLVFTRVGYQVVINMTVQPNSPEATFNVSATAAPGYRILEVKAALVPPPNLTARFHGGGGPGNFTWVRKTVIGALATEGVVTPSKDLGGLFDAYNGTHPPHIELDAKAPAIARTGNSVVFSLNLTTPKASNLIRQLPYLVSTTAVWANWTARFVLYSSLNVPAALLPSLAANAPAYLEGEYGAKAVYTADEWTVLLLPAYPT
jgi:hypothetical protein